MPLGVVVEVVGGLVEVVGRLVEVVGARVEVVGARVDVVGGRVEVGGGRVVVVEDDVAGVVPAGFEVWPLGVPAETDDGAGVFAVPDVVTSVSGIGRVWNASTAARPAAVEPITIGARLTATLAPRPLQPRGEAQNENASRWILSGGTPRRRAVATSFSAKPSGPQT